MPQPRFLQSVATGEQALRNGDAALARRVLEQALVAHPRHARASELLAYALRQSGDALGAHGRLLDACSGPDCSVQALYFLGGSHLERGEPREAALRFEQALRTAGDFFEGWHELGTAQSRAGDPRQALESYQKAAALQPQAFQVHYNMGRMHDELGDSAQAVKSYSRAIELQPEFAPAWGNRGVARSEQGDHALALVDHERAIQLDPADAQSWTSRGVTLGHLKRWEEALASHQRAVSIDPEHPGAWTNQGVTLQALQRLDEALACHNRALGVDPSDALIRANRGRCLHQLQRHDEALADLAVALDSAPRLAGAWSDKGIILAHLHRHAEALPCYDRALSLKPSDPETIANRATSLLDLGHRQDAVSEFSRAWSLRPDHDGLLGQLVAAQVSICDWTSLEARLADLQTRVTAGHLAVAPFAALGLFDDPAIGLQAARTWVRDKLPPPPAPTWVFPLKAQQERIVLGYFSADFHDHATAWLMAEFFELHDRTRFELVAFSTGPDRDDSSRRRLRAAFDRFIDVRMQADVAVAAQSRALSIDVAVDLKGHTRDGRPGIFAHRAAPVQVSWLGYPGSTGVDGIDYLLADPVVVPEEAFSFYSESVVHLPRCYQVNDRRRPLPTQAPSRAEVGLAGASFVYCCFNSSYKILPGTFDLWMRILAQVSGSVLWLLEGDPATVRNLRKEAVARQIDPDRLVFASVEPPAEHLARLQLADLVLDTLPYNAHTTASDALWVGVPVLTLLGRAFAGRVAGSLLGAAGMAELLVDTPEGYVELAIALAREPGRLQALKQKLVAARRCAPLFDTPAATLAVERAFIEMVSRQRAGLRPQPLKLGHW